MYQTNEIDLASEFIDCASFSTSSKGSCDKWVSEGNFVSFH